jgi:hypothetical protein
MSDVQPGSSCGLRLPSSHSNCLYVYFLHQNIREDFITKASLLRASNLLIPSSENSASTTCKYWRLVSLSGLALQHEVEKGMADSERRIFLKNTAFSHRRTFSEERNG